MKFYVDSWDPSYGASFDAAEEPDARSTAELDLDVERPAETWEPLGPPPEVRAPDVVLFVDGVRRIDATVWLDGTDLDRPGDGASQLQPGVAVSYAAGVVRCDRRRGTAEVVATAVRRSVFTATGAVPAGDRLGQGIWGYTFHPVERIDAADLGQLSRAVQPALTALEVELSHSTRADDDLLVVDGPLRGRGELPRTVGYVKTHATRYLPPEPAAVIGRLRPGQRTPVFRFGAEWQRYSWYLRLPGPPGSPWAGVVRVEASTELTPAVAVELADRCALTLPRFASSAYKDPRAPQNLVPIAGLERRLRRMLGDPRLLVRSLTAAAAA